MTVAPDALVLTLWAGAQIFFINVLLSGDNALAIAMACRRLAPTQRRQGIWLGTVLALLLRFVLVLGIGAVMRIPFMHLAAALLLAWVAVQLVRASGDVELSAAAPTTLARAILTIMVADLSMSLDNALAVAAAAQSIPGPARQATILIALLVSIPMFVLGSRLILSWLDRHPWLVYVGTALLGWVTGELICQEPAATSWLNLVSARVAWPPGLLIHAVSLALAVALPGIGRQTQHRPAPQG